MEACLSAHDSIGAAEWRARTYGQLVALTPSPIESSKRMDMLDGGSSSCEQKHLSKYTLSAVLRAETACALLADELKEARAHKQFDEWLCL